MTVLSKPVVPGPESFFQTLSCTCYEIGHTWNPSCIGTHLNVIRHGLIFSAKVYFPLYFLTTLLKCRKAQYRNKRTLYFFLRNATQSTVFLASNAFFFMSFFCLFGKIFGCYHGTFAYIVGFLSCAISIMIERKERRGMLGLYLLNLATESVYKMAVSRGFIKPVKNFEVLIFSVASAVFISLFRTQNGLPDFIQGLLKQFLGEQECSNAIRIPRPTNTNQIVKVSRYYQTLKFVEKLFKVGPKHGLCKHRSTCFGSSIELGLKNFGIGYALQILLDSKSILMWIFKGKTSKKPLMLNFQLAKFFGCSSFLFQIVNCALRHLTAKDIPRLHGAISGFIAGLASYFYKSTTISLYIFYKGLEILYFKGIERGTLPYSYYGDFWIYTLSMALLFHVVVLEPHNMRPSYYKFLSGLSHNKFPEMFRLYLDAFGTKASKMMPNFVPALDKRYIKNQHIKAFMKKYSHLAVKTSIS